MNQWKFIILFIFFIIAIRLEFYIIIFFENWKIIYNYKNNIFNKSYIQNKNNYNNFNHILPKINLENNTIPSIQEIFNSRILYISNSNLTIEYLRYIRPINEIEEQKYKIKYFNDETIIDPGIFKKKKDQYNYTEFTKLCLDEKLIDSKDIKYENKPLISIIIPTYNKEDILLKSIRSIQNQSFKNIEIIILDDCSTDNTQKYYNYLMQTDPRIRIFNHLSNMGVLRTRIDGFLYSRGKYVIGFDPSDLYEDNYVLEDLYNIMEIYKLDSLKFLFRKIWSYEKINESLIPLHLNEKSKIIYNSSNIEKNNENLFKKNNYVWNRIIRANIYTKGLYLLRDIILNLYKNFSEDEWINYLVNKVSYSFAIIERIGYIYLVDQNGIVSSMEMIKTEFQKDKIIKEYLEFLYFDYIMLPETDDKRIIIKKLKKLGSPGAPVQLKFLKSKYYILTDLIKALISDPYISNKDKAFLNRLIIKTKKRMKNAINIY